MIKKDIKLEKKNQRKISSDKRFLIHKSLDITKILFYNILNNFKWYEDSSVIASFLSIRTEFPTTEINKFILESGKILCLPVIKKKDDGIIFKSFAEGDSLSLGKFGVKEPINTITYLPDIIIAPCLAFDKFGFRLGYGGGYYDKIISHLNSIGHNFLTIGLAYDDQRVQKVSHDNLDQKLNYILTEKQLYKIS